MKKDNAQTPFNAFLHTLSIVHKKHASHNVPDGYNQEMDQKNRQLPPRQSSKGKVK
jgi:hypothetical protein